jgi:hypothetical protein
VDASIDGHPDLHCSAIVAPDGTFECHIAVPPGTGPGAHYVRVDGADQAGDPIELVAGIIFSAAGTATLPPTSAAGSGSAEGGPAAPTFLALMAIAGAALCGMLRTHRRRAQVTALIARGDR